MKITPTFDRILLKRESLQEKASLIHIPESVEGRTRPARGIILAMGPTCGFLDDDTKKVVRDLEVGTKVIFGRNAGVELEVEGEKLWLVSDRDVLAKVEE